MRLYDEDHNWISERAIDPVINIFGFRNNLNIPIQSKTFSIKIPATSLLQKMRNHSANQISALSCSRLRSSAAFRMRMSSVRDWRNLLPLQSQWNLLAIVTTSSPYFIPKPNRSGHKVSVRLPPPTAYLHCQNTANSSLNYLANYPPAKADFSMTWFIASLISSLIESCRDRRNHRYSIRLGRINDVIAVRR